MFDNKNRATPTSTGSRSSSHALATIPESLRAVVNHLADPKQFPLSDLTKEQQSIVSQIRNSDTNLKRLRDECKKMYLAMESNEKKLAATGDTSSERNFARHLLASNEALVKKIDAINKKIGTINEYLKVCAPYSDPKSPVAQSYAEHLRSLMKEYSDGQAALLNAKKAGALRVSGARVVEGLSLDDAEKKLILLNQRLFGPNNAFKTEIPRGTNAARVAHSRMLSEVKEDKPVSLASARQEILKSFAGQWYQAETKEFWGIHADLFKMLQDATPEKCLQLLIKNGSSESRSLAYLCTRTQAALGYLDNEARRQDGLVTETQRNAAWATFTGDTEIAAQGKRGLDSKVYSDPGVNKKFSEDAVRQKAAADVFMIKAGATAGQVAGTIASAFSGQLYAIPAIWAAGPATAVATRAYVEDSSLKEAATKELKNNWLTGTPASVLGEHLGADAPAWKLLALDALIFIGAGKISHSLLKDPKNIAAWAQSRFGRELTQSEIHSLTNACTQIPESSKVLHVSKSDLTKRFIAARAEDLIASGKVTDPALAHTQALREANSGAGVGAFHYKDTIFMPILERKPDLAAKIIHESQTIHERVQISLQGKVTPLESEIQAHLAQQKFLNSKGYEFQRAGNNLHIVKAQRNVSSMSREQIASYISDAYSPHELSAISLAASKVGHSEAKPVVVPKGGSVQFSEYLIATDAGDGKIIVRSADGSLYGTTVVETNFLGKVTRENPVHGSVPVSPGQTIKLGDVEFRLPSGKDWNHLSFTKEDSYQNKIIHIIEDLAKGSNTVITLGRGSGNTIPIDGSLVSRSHCRLLITKDLEGKIYCLLQDKRIGISNAPTQYFNPSLGKWVDISGKSHVTLPENALLYVPSRTSGENAEMLQLTFEKSRAAVLPKNLIAHDAAIASIELQKMGLDLHSVERLVHGPGWNKFFDTISYKLQDSSKSINNIGQLKEEIIEYFKARQP